MVVLFAKVFASVRGMEKGKLLLLHSRERRHFFRACFARLSKVVVLFAKVFAPVRGMERGKLLSLCWPLKSGGFICKIIGNSKRYGERETSLTLLEREGGTFSVFSLPL